MGKRITIGGYQPTNSVHSRGMRSFAEALSRLTNDEVEVDFTQNITEQGRKAADLFDLVESGELDGCYFSSSYLSERVPELALLDQHFAVPGRAQAYQLLDGALGRRLAEIVAAKTGYVVLGFWDNGLRHISTVSKPLKDPKDCEGLTLRILPSEGHKRIFKSLGFDPKFIDVSDLPDAVTSGRVVAQENPLTNTYNFELYKTHRTITLTGHLLGVALVLFNAKTFASWTGELQKTVCESVDEATRAQRQFAQDDDAVCADAMAKDGVHFVTLSAEERNAFAMQSRKEVDATRSGLSPDLIALFENELAQSFGGHA